ncbi:MAG TPA: hypothetical protein VIO14_01090 [Dehalococcoidia bacterium]
MGREQLEALIRVLQQQLEAGTDGVVLGTWTIRYDKERTAFYFDKCEYEGYCQERPAVIAVTGEVLDPGGPLFDA